MVSAEAMRPGDIFTASNGKTIEVRDASFVRSDVMRCGEELLLWIHVHVYKLVGRPIVNHFTSRKFNIKMCF